MVLSTAVAMTEEDVNAAFPSTEAAQARKTESAEYMKYENTTRTQNLGLKPYQTFYTSA